MIELSQRPERMWQPKTAIAPGEFGAERADYAQVILEDRLRQALARVNPALPPEALDDAFRKLTRAEAPSHLARNRAVYRMLVDGVTVEYRRADGSIGGAQARALDFDAPENNDWLAINFGSSGDSSSKSGSGSAKIHRIDGSSSSISTSLSRQTRQ